jgi:hypothetical protein
MTEPDDNSQAQQARVSKPAIAAFVSAIILLGCALVAVAAKRSGTKTPAVVLYLSAGSCLAALVFVAAAAVGINRSQGLITGQSLVVAALCVLSLCVILAPIIRPTTRPRSVALRPVCAANLKSLGGAFVVYIADYDTYPPADKWCDLLIDHCNVSPKTFICDHSDCVIGESSYAINTNVAGRRDSELPPDMLVLFETTAGWNQSGGLEIFHV